MRPRAYWADESLHATRHCDGEPPSRGEGEGIATGLTSPRIHVKPAERADLFDVFPEIPGTERAEQLLERIEQRHTLAVAQRERPFLPGDVVQRAARTFGTATCPASP